MKKTARLPFIVVAVAAALTILAQVQAADARRVPTVEDLMALKSLGGPRISPDGTRVAYTVTETDLEQDAYVTQIWLADVASGEIDPADPGQEVLVRSDLVARRALDRLHFERGSTTSPRSSPSGPTAAKRSS